MGCISTCIFHRDIHPRNMLLEDRGPDKLPHFGLVDFGLAVNAEVWQQGGWRARGAAGDCRYWPPSAWVMFVLGPEDLDRHAAWRQEYESHLDLHAVGLSALEMFV